MTAWTVPSTGTWHLKKDADPHPLEACGDWCASQGWHEWVEKDAVVDIDDDPNKDPGRFGWTGTGDAGDSAP